MDSDAAESAEPYEGTTRCLAWIEETYKVTSLLEELALDLTADSDNPDNLNAQLHKALGQALEEHDSAAAIAHYQRAIRLHGNCGAKKRLNALQRQIERAATAPDNPAPQRGSHGGGGEAGA